MTVGSLLKSLKSRASQRRLPLLYTGFTVFVFLVAIIVTFPHETLIRQGLDRATAGSDTTVDFKTLQFRPLLGYHVEDLRVVPDRDEAFELRVAGLQATPSIISLLVPGRRNALDLELDIWGGELAARLAGDPDDFAITAAGSGLNLEDATRGLLPANGKIYGSAALELDAEGTDQGRTIDGTLILAVRDLALRDLMARGFKVPDLTFETLDLSIEAAGDTLQVRNFVATGNEVSIRATGKIKLNRSWKRSMLDLRFELTIDPDAPSGLRVLPRLLPKRKNGETFYDIIGTLGNPRIQ